MGAVSIKNILESMNLKEVFTYSDLVRKRGWTDYLVSKYLNPIDRSKTEYYNNFYAPNIRLYYKEDVFSAESNSDFRRELNSVGKLKTKNNSCDTKKITLASSIQSVINNIKVIYVDSEVLEDMATEYTNIYLNSHPETFPMMVNDKNFTENCKYMIVRDLLTTYKNDMQKLKNYKASLKDLTQYDKVLFNKILQIYPQLGSTLSENLNKKNFKI